MSPAGSASRAMSSPSARPIVTVVGLGPAGPDLLTAATTAAIAAIGVRFIRTTRHPAAVAVPDAVSFEHHYEASCTVEGVYQAIVEDLVAAAGAHGQVLYAVPGSPAVAERTVELLRADERVATEVLPALSCLDLTWARLGVDPLASGVRVVDGHRFSVEAAGERGPLLVLQCDRAEVLVDIKLSVDDLDDPGSPGDLAGIVPVGRDAPVVTVLQRLGLPDERIETIPWEALDRVVPDHLTSLWIAEMAVPVGRELVRFAELVHTLRERCSWDRVQTHVTLRPYLVEEAYEVLDAIDGLNPESAASWGHLSEELGDLLFQVYFHAALAAEQGQFNLADVARGIHDKLVRRHPHVFTPGGEAGGNHPLGATAGPATAGPASFGAEPSGGDRLGWEAIKRQEQGRSGAMDGVAASFPSLMYAQKVQRKAAGAGFDWADVEGAWPKVTEEINELKEAAVEGDPRAVEEELGDLLFACVNVARHLGVDAEVALRGATTKFRQRFNDVERLAAERGISLVGADLVSLDALWDEVKSVHAAATSAPRM